MIITFSYSTKFAITAVIIVPVGAAICHLFDEYCDRCTPRPTTVPWRSDETSGKGHRIGNHYVCSSHCSPLHRPIRRAREGDISHTERQIATVVIACRSESGFRKEGHGVGSGWKVESPSHCGWWVDGEEEREERLVDSNRVFHRIV
uniref:Uncharacterized protein n=1 Tax=Anopheles culicifacies TaxID=139723 RepID=A0A182LUY8_9DIPT